MSLTTIDPATVATRDAIRTAAFPLFLDQGVEQTSVEQIAEATGITEQELLEHYSTPADILLVNDSYHRLLAAFVGEDASLCPSAAWIVAIESAAARMTEATWQNEILRQRLIATDPVVGPHAVPLAMDLIESTRVAVAARTGLPVDSKQVIGFAGGLIGAISSMPSGAYPDPESWMSALAESVELLSPSLERMLR